ncbi:MAG: hypothetical protein ABR599_09495 [Gemmatimonadota bacterium]
MLTVRILRLPHSAHPEEFEALAAEPEVDLRFVDRAEELGVPDMVVLPGSEATIPDVTRMRETGMDAAVRRAAERGSLLFGICGGFQMLGTELHDPEGLEGGAPTANGLGVLPVRTTFTRNSIDERVQASAGRAGFLDPGATVSGFELHGGCSTVEEGADVVSLLQENAKGDSICPLALATRDYAAMGTYLHGILADPVFRRRILEHLRSRRRQRGEASSAPPSGADAAASL